MQERANELARAAVRATGDFFGGIFRAIIEWIRGDDVMVLIVLAVIALFLLFLFVPSHRRY